jgi:alpha-tubulin suppressor-like RCC1 family protein
MNTKTSHSTYLTLTLSLGFLLSAGAALASSCTAEFKTRCPDGTEQRGGGDVNDPDVCRPVGEAGGAGGGAGAGGAGTGGQQGGAGQGGGDAGASGGGQGGGAGGAGGAALAAGVLALGEFHSCAHTTNAVLCWGDNEFGQLGNSSPSSTASPTPVVDSGLLFGVHQVVLGGKHSCALRDDGRVLCWGRNYFGQLGNDMNMGELDTNPVPTLVDNAALGVVRQLSLGSDHTCALRDDGRVLCWGNNRYGQLGTAANNGTGSPNPVPTLVDHGALGVVRQLATSGGAGFHSCALRDDGRVLCWGYNNYGQLGSSVNNGTMTPNPSPTLVASGAVVGVRQVAIGYAHTCALRDDGRVSCWGDNSIGQLGSDSNSGTTIPNPVPILIDDSELTNVRQIAVGRAHGCGLRGDGRALCWGLNSFGQLGHGTNSTTNTPNPAPALIDAGALAGVELIVAGNYHSCAVQGDGRALCWGRNSHGQLGSDLNVNTVTANPAPTQVQNLPLLLPPISRFGD